MFTNSICQDCTRLGRDCPGTTCKTWTGCVYRTTEAKEAYKMNKYYARQVSPEEQDPHLFYITRSGNWIWEDEYWENVAFIPQRGFYDYMPDAVRTVYDNLENGVYMDDPGLDAGPLAPAAELIRNYGWDYLRQVETLCTVLELLTGKKYKQKEIHGSAQREWRLIVYPSEQYTDDDIRTLETAYFNTGTEWIVPETDPSVDGEYSLYCFESGTDNIKKEIADSLGVDPAAVVLQVFTGYKRIPQYSEE